MNLLTLMLCVCSERLEGLYAKVNTEKASLEMQLGELRAQLEQLRQQQEAQRVREQTRDEQLAKEKASLKE